MKIALLAGLMAASLFSTNASAGIFDHWVVSSDSALKRATAIALRDNTPLDSITISDVHRKMTSVSWNAQTPSGNYSCSDDDMLRGLAYCSKGTKQD